MNMEARKNDWRRKTSGPVVWADRLAPASANKYFMISCDNHANEPMDFLTARVDKKYADRTPHIKVDADGTQWIVCEGWPPQPVKIPSSRRDLLPTKESFESFEVLAPYTDKMEDEDVLRQAAGRTLDQRIKDRESQGTDAEIIFPQKGTLCFATPDPVFQGVMCRAWNRWAKEYFADDWDRSLPMAMIAAGDMETAIAEIQWAEERFSRHPAPKPARLSSRHRPASSVGIQRQGLRAHVGCDPRDRPADNIARLHRSGSACRARPWGNDHPIHLPRHEHHHRAHGADDHLRRV